MRTAVAIVAMISGKLWFFMEALVLICLIKLIKGVFN